MRKGQQNPGNRGHGGYKMSTMTDMRVGEGEKEDRVIVTLSCGHTEEWFPFGERETVQEWLDRLLSEPRPFIIGTTKLRCEQCRSTPEKEAGEQ